MLRDNLIDTIGDTPLTRLQIGGSLGVEVYAKLEMQNLFGMKDRVAKHIITHARRHGLLAPGAPIIESSSGTMALGIALVGTGLGHPVHIVTDPRIDRITLAKLHVLGCVVHMVEKMDGQGWQGARLFKLAELMDQHPGAFWPRQYENPGNPAAYEALAGELTADLDRIDILVGSVGSGGSLCGTARVLRGSMPELRVVGVDCVGSVLFGQPDQPQRLQSGLGNSLHPPNLDHSVVDEVHWLNDREAFAATELLARTEKLFAGNTSGSVYLVMTELARRARRGTRIVGIFPDRGDRYAETVYNPDHWAEHGLDHMPQAERPRRVTAETVVRGWSYRPVDDEARRDIVAFVESNTTGTGMLALDVADRLGLQPVLLTSDPERYPGLADRDCPIVRCDPDDPADLLQRLSEAMGTDRVAAVTTTSEFYAPAAARLAGALELPAEDPEAVSNVRDKSCQRLLLAQAEIRQPAFAIVGDGPQAAAAAARIGLPCVVKPVDHSGSTLVRQCDSPEEAAAHAERILEMTENVRGQPTARKVLVEQYLNAPEFSVEMFGIDGEHHLLGIVEKAVTGSPHFVEHCHLLPAPLPADVIREVVSTVCGALLAVGLTRGPTHTEVKLTPDGASVIEINPRLAGGMIPELFRLTSGVDLLECQIRHAVNEPPKLPDGLHGAAGVRFLMAASHGVFEGVHGVAAATALDDVERVVITARPGQRVGPPQDAYGRLGYVIARGDKTTDVADTLAKASDLITFVMSDQDRRG